MTYFELFRLPVSIQIDQTKLKSSFLELQQQYHPDKATNKEQALIQSSEINQAYNTLLLVDSRAAYLLKLQQQDHNLDQSIHDLMFLQDALELRESLEEAQNAEQIKVLKKHVQQHINELTNMFASAYSQMAWHDAQEIVRKLKFFQRVFNDIDKAEDRLFDDEFNLDDEF